MRDVVAKGDREKYILARLEELQKSVSRIGLESRPVLDHLNQLRLHMIIG